MSRREFSVAQKIGIAMRATDGNGRIHCERCGVWVKTMKEHKGYEIDHILEEAMLSDADKARPLNLADGQLMCIECHRKKTDAGKGDLARAKRREAADLGIERPGKQKMRKREKKEKRLLRVANGRSQIARRYGL